ncbi:Fic family protein [Sphingomonas sp. PR090111-T3T-6A]|uniref:Fic family protein n=1 Tax=Sphingomonas sp. PR090111-T3T-6A TaxID=685778 RepID=UPI00138ABEBB|nr:Fic family protein [Sphingomonas sp. PR090111-T3T-6A]
MTIAAQGAYDFNNILDDLAYSFASDPAMFSALEDPLSSYLPRSETHCALQNRTLGERGSLRALDGVALSDVLRSDKSFLDALLAVQSLSLSELAHVRPGNIFSTADDMGTRKLFPPSDQILPLFAKVVRTARELGESSQLLAAIYIYNMILVIHPFRDGNGRVGRIMLNWQFRMIVPGFDYLPLYETRQYSMGGWLLALRRVERQDDWQALIRYIQNVSAVWRIVLERKAQRRI